MPIAIRPLAKGFTICKTLCPNIFPMTTIQYLCKKGKGERRGGHFVNHKDLTVIREYLSTLASSTLIILFS
jgi:hypothetical protein